MIELNFQSTDVEAIRLAESYWRVDAKGKFVHTVSSLLPWRDTTTIAELNILLRSIVVARDTNLQCLECGQLEIITARSQFKPRSAPASIRCSRCRDMAEQSKRAAAEAAKKELENQVAALAKHKIAMRFDFSGLPDDMALLLLAIDRAIAPRLVSGTFSIRDCRLLVPHDHHVYITRLVRNNAIIVRPDLSPDGTYKSVEGALSYYAEKAVYQMTVPVQDRPRAQVVGQLREREYGPSAGMTELWLDYVSSECLCYAHDQAHLHNLPIDEELGLQIASTVRAAAESYSIALLWSAIWRVVRDAATLARRDYYSAPKAAATIPGKIMRLLAKVEDGTAVLKPWSRPELQPAGTLGELFWERYGVDEDTAGATALEILRPSDPPHTVQSSSDSPAIVRSHVDQLFLAASGHGAALEVLSAFSQALEQGFSIPDAISHVYDVHPYLNDPY